MSISRIKSPYDRFKIGQRIDVLVKDIDNEKNRIAFTYKELLGTWEDNVKNFEQGKVFKGIVRDTTKDKDGVFIELTPNLVGLTEYRDNLEYGQNVDVYIKKIIPDKKKIKLNII